MCITYSVLSCKLTASFSIFSIFILSGEMINHHEVAIIFQDIENQLQENICHHVLDYSFL